MITMEEARAKLIRFLTFVFVRIEKLRGGNKFDMYKVKEFTLRIRTTLYYFF